MATETNQLTRRKKDSARLVWDTKPRRAPNPRDIEFQTAEIVVPNPERDLKQLPLGFGAVVAPAFRPARGVAPTFRSVLFEAGQHAGLKPGATVDIDKTKMNRLIWGDNLLAMQALLAQGYEGKVQLIYIDPPFNSDEKYNYQTKVNVTGLGQIQKEASVIERLAYKDTWAGGADSYLDMLCPRLQVMRRLLAESGNLFLHLDWRMVHYVKALLDEVFGLDRFVQEIIWQHQIMGGAHGGKFPKAHETILWYSKSENYKFEEKNPRVRVEYSDYVKNSMAQDEDGRWFYTRRRMSRKATTDELARKAHTVTFVENPELGTLASDVWSDMLSYQPLPREYTGFDTQKPGRLLERVIAAGSAEDDLVADFFSGSGTIAVSAESLKRRWVACELGKVGIQVSRARLVEMGARPFLIENIGNYQREMIYLSGGRINEMLNIILKLFGATPRKDYQGLGVRRAGNGVAPGFSPAQPERNQNADPKVGPTTAQVGKTQSADLKVGATAAQAGRNQNADPKVGATAAQAGKTQSADLKAGATGGATGEDELVFVGYPDRPVTARRVEEIAKMAEKLDGRGYRKLIVLAWDYDYNYSTELEKRLKSLGEKPRVKVESRMIPPDIYEHLKKAKDEDEIEPLREKVKFYEKPYMKLNEPKIKRLKDGKAEVTVGLARYVIFDFPVEDEEERAKLRKLAKDNFAVFIDYWAIDWDYDGFTFKSLWQDIRGNGRKTKVVSTSKAETLEAGKKRTIAVRVVDVFGNDATATVELAL